MSTANKILMGASGAGGPVGPSDDEFNRVSFLSHFDGANNGVNNVFDDGSASNHTITANGDVTQGSFGPFARPDGEWGVSFHGDSTNPTNDYLQLPASSDFDFGTGDFTIEFFFFARDAAGSYEYLVTFGNNKNSTTSLGIYIAGGTSINLWNNGAITSSTSYNLNQWYHLAVARASGTVKVYLDGSEIKSASLSSDISSPDGGSGYSGNVANWRQAGDTEYFNGVISNLRVVKGTAVYTGNFTAPTSKLTAITNTVLLTLQSNRLVDNSASGHYIQPRNSPSVTAFGPFLTSAVYDAAVNGASAYFDGTGDDLVAANSTDFDLSSGDFTISMWVYPDSSSPTGNVEGLITKAFYSLSGNSGWQLWWQVLSGTPSLRFLAYGSSNQVFNGPTFYGNQWSYVTVVRTGNTLKLFLNGVEGLSSAISDFTNYTGTLTIGSTTNWTADNYFSGYMCDVFICKGTAVYTSNFTPPTAPLTAITNTKLLLNMADGQAIDSAAQNNLTLAGNANTSTDQAKFGDTSLHLDGNGDYAYIPETENFTFGTGDFTIEFWYYGDATQNDYLFDMRVSADNEARASVYFNSGNRLSYYTSNTTRITSNTALSTSTWTHIALVRSSAVTRFYFNGTQDNQSFSDTLDMPSAQLVIGGKYTDDSQRVTGYFDDFRISRMARYTSNFTAPSEPFADKGQ